MKNLKNFCLTVFGILFVISGYSQQISFSVTYDSLKYVPFAEQRVLRFDTSLVETKPLFEAESELFLSLQRNEVADNIVIYFYFDIGQWREKNIFMGFVIVETEKDIFIDWSPQVVMGRKFYCIGPIAEVKGYLSDGKIDSDKVFLQRKLKPFYRK
jgi:hypothetical protein